MENKKGWRDYVITDGPEIEHDGRYISGVYSEEGDTMVYLCGYDPESAPDDWGKHFRIYDPGHKQAVISAIYQHIKRKATDAYFDDELEKADVLKELLGEITELDIKIDPITEVYMSRDALSEVVELMLSLESDKEEEVKDV